MKIIEMNTQTSNSKKPIFHRNKYYKNRTKLELKSIDLVASQDLKSNNILSDFDRLEREKKSKISDSISINDLTNQFLKTSKIGQTTKISPEYLNKKEQQVKRESVFKPKKSFNKPKEKISIKNQTVEKIEETKERIKNNVETDNNNVAVMHNENINYKNIEIDLKQNQIELKDMKTSDASDMCDDKVSILSATESLKTASKNDGSKLAKSFLEKFFDNEPLSDLIGDNEETLVDECAIEKDEPKEESKENSDQNVSDNVNLFIDNLFNYKPNRSYSEKSFIGYIKKQTSIDDKLQALNNLKLNDPKLVKTVQNFTSAYEILNNPRVSYFINNRNNSHCKCIQNCLECCLKQIFSTHDTSLVDKCCNECTEFKKSDISLEILEDESFDNIFEASNLLSNNEFNRFIKNFKTINSNLDCYCHFNNNSFKCCIEKLYDKLVVNEFDGKIEEFSCCGMCLKRETSDKKLGDNLTNLEEKKEHNFCSTKINNEESKNKSLLINQNSVDDELYETTEVDVKRLSLMRKSLQESFEEFFKQANKEPERKDVEIENLKIDGNDVINETKNSKKQSPDPVQSITPRKTIIKNNKPNEQNNLNKKSVTFFEDPKYGFRVVEVPDWLEHLRDPVYSKNFNKSLKEWKN